MVDTIDVARKFRRFQFGWFPFDMRTSPLKRGGKPSRAASWKRSIEEGCSGGMRERLRCAIPRHRNHLMQTMLLLRRARAEQLHEAAEVACAEIGKEVTSRRR